VTAPALFTTTLAQPFALADGMTLLVLIDGPDEVVTPTEAPITGGDFVHVTFAAKDIPNIGSAAAQDVADVLNAAFVAQAAAGSPPAAVASVNGSNQIVVTAALETASNGGPGFLLQVLVQSTSLAALGLVAGISYPSPWPPVYDPVDS
jgi:hypothetical protein